MAPWKKSRAARRRSPRALRATSSASNVAASKHHSAAGSACARLPQNVPHPDRIVRDVANHGGKHRPERAGLNGTMERGVTRPCTDAQDTIVRGENVQPGDGVDVDQMRRTCEAESHDRH